MKKQARQLTFQIPYCSKILRLESKTALLRFMLISFCYNREFANNQFRLRSNQPNSHQTSPRLFVWIYLIKQKNNLWHSAESFPLIIKVPLKHFEIKLRPYTHEKKHFESEKILVALRVSRCICFFLTILCSHIHNVISTLDITEEGNFSH